LKTPFSLKYAFGVFIAIAITLTTSRVHADTINGTGWKGTTQSGGVGQFSQAANWDSTGPGAGERNLFFGDAWSDPAKGNRTGATTANNDLASQNLYRITFQPAHAGSGADQTFTLTGNALNLFDFSNNFPKIENTSSVNQIINNNVSLNGTNGGAKGELDPTGGDLTLNGTVDLAGTTALQVFGGGGHTLTIGGVLSSSGNGGANTVTDETNNIIVYKAANTYSGDTFILNGKLQFTSAGSANNSTIRLGDTAANANSPTIDLITTTGGTTIGSVINPRAGSTGTLSLNSQNTSGTNTLSSHIGLDHNFTITQSGGGELDITQARSGVTTNTGYDIKGFTATFTPATNGIINVSGDIYNSVNNGNVTMNGAGTLNLSGNNTYSGTTTVNSGTLIAAAAGALGGTTAINVNSSGSLNLSGAGTLNRVNNAATVGLGGGTFGIAPTGSGANAVLEGTGAHSVGGVVQSGTSAVGLGALTLNSSSTLDFGASGVGTMVFSSFSRVAGTLNILNYTTLADAGTQTSGTDTVDDRLIFNQDQTANLAFFSFNGMSAYEIALGGGFFELTPIPEPGTWVAGSLAIISLAFTQHRRLARVVTRRK
jgi:autotransporter-associated beta strand protein